MKTIFTYNRIGLVHIAGMLSPAECQELISIGKSAMQQATVVDDATGEYFLDAGRKSQMAWPDRAQYPLLQRIAEGVARLTGVPVANQEPLQVLHYLPGGEYKPHFDAFPRGSMALEKGGNRMLTLIFYLNEVKKGGETTFPEAGIAVNPIPGTGVVFRSLRSDDSIDPFALHAGAPIIEGEKWIATTWIRQRAYFS